jgi:hypothetical protein
VHKVQLVQLVLLQLSQAQQVHRVQLDRQAQLALHQR